jgi:hypothetical protein
MTDDELRQLVRKAIAQYASGQPVSVASCQGPPTGNWQPIADIVSHPSHGRFMLLPVGSDTDGPCLIEPTVLCNHCGYCQSYGH